MLIEENKIISLKDYYFEVNEAKGDDNYFEFQIIVKLTKYQVMHRN